MIGSKFHVISRNQNVIYKAIFLDVTLFDVNFEPTKWTDFKTVHTSRYHFKILSFEKFTTIVDNFKIRCLI